MLTSRMTVGDTSWRNPAVLLRYPADFNVGANAAMTSFIMSWVADIAKPKPAKHKLTPSLPVPTPRPPPSPARLYRPADPNHAFTRPRCAALASSRTANRQLFVSPLEPNRR